MTSTTARSTTQAPPAAPRWLEPVLLAAFTVVIRIPALLAERHLTFDDGVFGASAVAMREGDLPFRDVFSSQGPLFLPLVSVADLLGLRTLNSPRLLTVASGVGLVLATWAIARRLVDRRAGIIAALLVATSGSVLFVTAPLAADGPALAFATLAIAAGLRWRDRPTTRWLLAVGALTGGSLVVKALAIWVVVPVGLIIVFAPGPLTRRAGRLATAVAAAVAVALVPSVLLGFSDVWDQSITYHLEVAKQREPLANLGKLASTFASRDAIVLAVAVVALGTLVVRLARKERARPHLRLPDGQLTGGAVVASWLVAVLVVLAQQEPLWRPHVAHLVAPVVVLAVLCRPTTRGVVLAALVGALTFWFPSSLPILWPAPYGSSASEAVEVLQDLPDGALAISDDPGLVYRAGRATPPDWVDGSILLIETERVTEDSIVDEAERPDVCAVLIWSDERWGSFEDLPDRLEAAGYSVAAEPEDGKTVYVKDDCEPS